MTMQSMKVLVLCLFTSVIASSLHASGEKSDRDRYIEEWKELAIEQMYAHGIPASITLAQGILESGNGKSILTRQANNHFGIKCHGWDGPGVFKDDDRKNECFRKYNEAKDSFEDHSLFLKRPRYQALFELDIKDYKGWAKGLKKAGYATDPAYARRLIRIIEDNELYRYDEELLASVDKVQQQAKPRFEEQSRLNSADREVIDLRRYREVFQHANAVRFVKARQGDDIHLIAEDLDLAPWQISKYNDLPRHHRFSGGEVVFIQPKRKRATAEYHIAIKGETLRTISQRYGVKLKFLVKYNGLSADSPLSSRTKVHLRKPSG
ncbi:MAG: LysM peptidoglycan-binding domain-containing protein [Flavobacteriales bacterium]|nr:LysM peptidoglycan-binding domain-containing protein [Flavobacteriales bacterium]